MKDVLDRYGEVLREVDAWFTRCCAVAGDEINCRHGCAQCCRGLFDITLLDALYLRRGFDLLPATEQAPIRSRAKERLARLEAKFPDFTYPWLLNRIDETRRELLMPEDDGEPCIFLDGEGGCRVYEWRPMTCRLHGIPLIDAAGDDLADEYCTLNFTRSDPEGFPGLRYPFRELFAQELLLVRELTTRLYGRGISEIDTVIPAAVLLDPHGPELATVCL